MRTTVWIIVFFLIFQANCRDDRASSNIIQKITKDIVSQPENVLDEIKESDKTKEDVVEVTVEFDRIAYEKEGFIWLISPDGKENEKLVQGNLMNWSPDGQYIFYYTYQDDVLVIKMFNRHTQESQTILAVRVLSPQVRARNNFWARWEKSQLFFNSISNCFWWTEYQVKKHSTSHSVTPIESESPISSTFLCNAGYRHFFDPFVDCTCITFAPDSKKIAFDIWKVNENEKAHGAWHIYWTGLEKIEVLKVTKGSVPIFGSDSETILFSGGSSSENRRDSPLGLLYTVKLDGSEQKYIAKGIHLGWSYDNKTVLYCTPDYTSAGCVTAWDMDTHVTHCWGPLRGLLWLVEVNASSNARRLQSFFVKDMINRPIFLPAAFSSTKNEIAFIGQATRSDYLGFIDAATGNVRKVRISRLIRIYPKSWSPDGSRIAIETLGKTNKAMVGEVEIVDTIRGVSIMTLTNVFNSSYSWAPNSRYFVYESEGKLFIADTETKIISPLTEGKHPLWCPK